LFALFLPSLLAGEVGVACSMAAGAVCHVQGGSIDQIEDAAEVSSVVFLFAFFSSPLFSQVGMEHNIGLSCDPIGGLVQIPCIERNVMGAAKAVASARLALLEDGKGMVRPLRGFPKNG
jgi:L-serine dehydratase